MSGIANHNIQQVYNFDDIIEVDPAYIEIENLPTVGRFRAIYENLLQLQQEPIATCVQKALELTSNQPRESDSDWLRVIFKSLEVLLSTIDTQNVFLNVK